MFGIKSRLSHISNILLYGIVNFGAVLGLISITKFNIRGSFQSQLLQSCIIVFVTGLIDYIVINRKIIKNIW